MTGPTLLCAAFSARQIAESARRSGIGALAVDFFGDLDLEQSALVAEVLHGDYPDGFDGEELLTLLERMAEGHSPIGFVQGAGFEDRTELLDRIGARWPILGTDAAIIRLLKDPEGFAALCARAGIDHPEIRRERVGDPSGWLSKKIGGAGGSHVQPATDAAPGADRYVQRIVTGEKWSAAFLAAEGRIAMLGFTRQWAAPSADEPFRYGGAVGPLEPPGDAGPAMVAAVERLAREVPLTGLASADFVVSPQGPVLLEINARFGATVDIYDRDEAPLLALHLNACRGRLPDGVPPVPTVRAAGLAWTDGPVHLPSGFVWPEWTCDRTRPPATFGAGQPLCTIVAEAADAAAAESLFHARVDELHELAGRMAA
ncbi:ATP-grasp domain-containing protein [Aurantimonas sp. A2-1-M11]|uniref:ATP-grasp domain-containing protein n=1 Tax=Aurantimonas sp. A2-1-M11 TaxID=3113712 RepID=UPI002F953AC1